MSPKAHFWLPGRRQRRRSSLSPPGAAPFLWNKRVPGTHWPQGGALRDRPAPGSRPPGCVQLSVPTRRSIMSVYTHRGKKARVYSAPHAQNQAQINPRLSGMGTKVAPTAPPQRPCSPPTEGWALGFQEVWAPERIQILTETAEAWELLSLSLGSRPREQRQSRVPPQQQLEKF